MSGTKRKVPYREQCEQEVLHYARRYGRAKYLEIDTDRETEGTIMLGSDAERTAQGYMIYLERAIQSYIYSLTVDEKDGKLQL